MNLDSSLNHTRLQFCRSQPLTLLHHRILGNRCRRISTAPKQGRQARNPFFTKTVSDCLCRYSSETWDSWCCFSCCHGPFSHVKYPDVAFLGCWCVRAVLQANGGHNRYWLWSDVIWTLWTLMWYILIFKLTLTSGKILWSIACTPIK
jgi:hypothetical protein